MPTFSHRPSYGAKQSKAPKVNVAAFGDGYSQRSARGINNDPANWAVSFNDLDQATADAIFNELKGYAGVTSFTWVDLDGNTGQYLSPTYDKGYDDEDKLNVTATFNQVYGG